MSKFCIKLTVLCFDTATDLVPVSWPWLLFCLIGVGLVFVRSFLWFCFFVFFSLMATPYRICLFFDKVFSDLGQYFRHFFPSSLPTWSILHNSNNSWCPRTAQILPSGNSPANCFSWFCYAVGNLLCINCFLIPPKLPFEGSS